MNLTKIIFGVALTAFCLISISYSLKCYVCNSKDSCKKSVMYECDPYLANSTRHYLQQFHMGVNANATSLKYDCFREYIKTKTGETYYKSCTYSNISGCSLHLSPYVSSSLEKRECNQCGNKDSCNPAGRADIDTVTVFTTVIVAAILRYKWH